MADYKRPPAADAVHDRAPRRTSTTSAALPDFESVDADTVEAVLEEAAKFASGVLAPTNWLGDRQGVQVVDDAVQVPAEFTDAYAKFCEGGWPGIAGNPDFGGQGLPKTVCGRLRRDVGGGQRGVRAVPGAVAGRDPRAWIATRTDELKATVPREADLRPVGGHDVPDRAAGRLGPRRASRPAPSRRAIATWSPARRSTSPGATTPWPRTSCTWCSRACRTRRRERRAYRCSWCRSTR